MEMVLNRVYKQNDILRGWESLLCFRTYKDIINGMEFNCCEEKLRGHDFREE